jgi:hypothetical protein
MEKINPITLVESLDVAQLRAELFALDRRHSAVRVLLRAALARQREDESGRRRAGRRKQHPGSGPA